MKTGNLITIIALLGMATAGYWLGSHRSQESGFRMQDAGSRIEDRGSKAAQTERKVLYYRNPMGLPDTSPVPRKDAMGMDYVPVYADNAGQGMVSISAEKVQQIGVKSESVALHSLSGTLRATGRIEIDERRIHAIAPKFEGWVERLYVNAVGESVSKGQPMFEVYSPELISAQREYAIARQGEMSLKSADEDARNGMRQLAEASLARLKNWDIPAAETKRLADGKTSRNLTYFAPVSGIVLEKKALQGMRFMPGETLYQIADLSTVWVQADVAEQDIARVKVGSAARISLEAYPGKIFEAKVSFIYPTLNAATRTVQVRLDCVNPGGLLKPAMFASVALAAGAGSKVLAVPSSAVIDSGTRQIVLVQRGAGRFEPRSVRLGRRDDDYVEVLEGVAEGEQVVTSANFLIDSESNLKAALAGLGGSAGKPAEAQDAKPKTVGHQAHGMLNSINPDGTVSITHGPIDALGWPGMTMNFELANSSLASGIRPGSAITFEIVERKPDDWVITAMQAQHKEP